MRLVFRQTLLDRIIDEVTNAVEAGRVVEGIVLTRTEMRELADMAPQADALPAVQAPIAGQARLALVDGETFVLGIPVAQEADLAGAATAASPVAEMAKPPLDG
jgi:hypothetical protein